MKSDHKYKIVLSDTSLDDLRDIFQYSELTFGNVVATEYRKGLEKQLLEIQKMPTIGHIRFDVSDKFLSWNYKRHSIFYSIDENEFIVNIKRVLHQKVNHKNHLK